MDGHKDKEKEALMEWGTDGKKYRDKSLESMYSSRISAETNMLTTVKSSLF